MNIKRIAAYLLPAVVILCFIMIMLSPLFFKGEKVSQEIARLTTDVMEEDWASANTRVSSIDMEWQRVIKRIQFGAERDEINQFSQCIARLKGVIKAQDKKSALTELAEVNCRWQSLGK